MSREVSGKVPSNGEKKHTYEKLVIEGTFRKSIHNASFRKFVTKKKQKTKTKTNVIPATLLPTSHQDFFFSPESTDQVTETTALG